jgi:hypothetical protein
MTRRGDRECRASAGVDVRRLRGRSTGQANSRWGVHRRRLPLRPDDVPDRDAISVEQFRGVGEGRAAATPSRALRATTHMSNSVTQLFYVNPAGAMMAAPITVTGATLAPGAPAAPITLLMNWNPRRRSNGSVSRRRQIDTPLRNVFAAVRSTEEVGHFSRLESITWSWWTRPGSNR